MFFNVARVPKSCKLNIFFILVIIRSIEMLHVFQRIESIHETQAGFSLEYQNMIYI